MTYRAQVLHVSFGHVGAGGTQVLNNGTSTTTFALPSNQVTIEEITMNLGTAYSVGKSRIGFDIMIEGSASSKRTYDLMLSYAYAFSGGVK
jgi:hypothetical protein